MTAQLDPGQQLNVGDTLVSWDGTTKLIMQADGNLVLYRNDNGAALWASNTWGKPVTHAIMQGDGNFVCYDNNGVAYWATGTWGNPGAFVLLQTDGDLVVYKQNGTILWSSTTVLFPTAQLNPGQQLNRNDKLDAANGLTSLIMQDDGNLVLYRNFDGLPLFASNTPGKPVTHAIMQQDGNFVCYDNNGVPYWSTNTWGNFDAFLVLQDDGNLVVNPIGTSTTPLWASNTVQNWDAADPGAPVFLIEVTPNNLIDVTDPTSLANFVDSVQGAVGAGAAQLQSVGLTIAGPNVTTAGLVQRIGLWAVSQHFPFAAPDPANPHNLPLLTPACAATGFSEVEALGPPPFPGLAFAFAIDIGALNTIAKAEVPKIQTALANSGVTVDSITVTGSPPSPFGLVGGDVVTTITGSGGFPTGNVSATVTETLGLVADASTGMMVPLITGTLSTSTDVASQLEAASASLLFNDFLGTALFVEALGITFGAPPLIGGKAGPVVAQIGAIINMIPPALPFEPDNMEDPNHKLPDFPKLIFNWKALVATAIEVLGKGTVTLVGRPPGSGRLTLTGPARLAGTQDDMAGGTAANYTVTWTDIAPKTISWRVRGATGNASGVMQAQTFPFEQGFTADFPLPDPIKPGSYGFTLTVTATEVDVKNPSQTLTAAAEHGVTANVIRNPINPP